MLVQADPRAEGDEDRQAELAEGDIDGRRELLPAPMCARSRTSTRSLRSAKRQATLSPITPPPMTIAS